MMCLNLSQPSPLKSMEKLPSVKLVPSTRLGTAVVRLLLPGKPETLLKLGISTKGEFPTVIYSQVKETWKERNEMDSWFCFLEYMNLLE